MPNLLEIQKTSYQWFLDTGLREVFADVGVAFLAILNAMRCLQVEEFKK